MNTLTKWICCFLLGALLWTVNAMPVLAQTSAVSDELRFIDPLGHVVNSASVTEANEDPLAVYFISDPTIVNPLQFGNYTALVEPDGSFSDVFGVANVNGTLFLAFSSDTETAPSPFGPGAPIRLSEGPGGTFDATQYLRDDLIAQGFRAEFFSDGEAPPVPEPSMLLILPVLVLMAPLALRGMKAFSGPVV